MQTIKDYAGVVALVILAILAVSGYVHKSGGNFGSTACGSITCLSGGLRLVSDAGGDFESDVAAVFNAGVSMAGNLAITGNLSVTGTTALTGTTTLSQSLKLAKVVAPSCIEMFATSTATKVKLSFTATTTIDGMTTDQGLLTYGYGTCN